MSYIKPCPAYQGDQEGGTRGLDGRGWRGLLEGVCRQVNEQLQQALDGAQMLLGKQDQVTKLYVVCKCTADDSNHCCQSANQSG